MAIQFMDGFDHYGTGANAVANMASGPWASVSSLNSIGAPAWGARTGPCALQCGSTARRVLPTPSAKVWVSMGFSVDGLPNGNVDNSICTFRDSSNAVMAVLYVQTTGNIVLTGSNSAVILATTSGPVVKARNWHFMEMLFDKTDQTFTLRVDDATGTGTPVLSATGMSFSGNCAQITVGEVASQPQASQAWIDDLLVHDASGSVNNGWLGDRRIATLFANTDTPTSGWTPSYFHEFGSGILRLGYLVAGNPGVNNPDAYIQAAAATSLDIGNADFTLETMVRFDQLPTGTNYSTIWGRWDTASNQRSYRLVLGGPSFNTSCLQFDTSTDGTNATVATPIKFPWVPSTNVWYHLALVRAAGELLLFIDGKQQGLPIADTNTYFGGGTEPLAIGIEQNSTNQWTTGSDFQGRMDETRFTNGVGRYTSTFSPPVAAFPRGSSDPDWADVVLLMGYDSSVADESSFARAIALRNNANFFVPNDGSAIGVFSTVNKAVPDDGTFIAASYAFASNILTMTTVPANNDTITLGTTDGTTPAVYTFKNTISTAFDVKIATGDAQTTLQNFFNAVNSGPGSGTAYGTGTTANFDVNAVELPIGQIEVLANLAGTGGNSIPSTATGTAAVWASTTLLGGATIPGPTNFRLQRPPNNTTIISGLQLNVRALKTDAGLADIQMSLIGGSGGDTDGIVHPLTTSVNYYDDVMEADPDTGGPISPTTIINGQVKINRTV
jgi:hypothetical protein